VTAGPTCTHTGVPSCTAWVRAVAKVSRRSGLFCDIFCTRVGQSGNHGDEDRIRAGFDRRSARGPATRRPHAGGLPALFCEKVSGPDINGPNYSGCWSSSERRYGGRLEARSPGPIDTGAAGDGGDHPRGRGHVSVRIRTLADTTSHGGKFILTGLNPTITPPRAK